MPLWDSGPGCILWVGIDAMRQRCIACSSPATSATVSVRHIPIRCNVLWETREQAVAAPRGDVELYFCRACGHLYNAAFDPLLMEYTADYENSLHYSPRFQRYASSVVERLIERYDIRRRRVVDLGCGKGEFLRLLCVRGDNQGLGFDPSYTYDRDEGDSTNVSFIKDYYPGEYGHLETDLICCRHVLEHLPEPAGFLAELRANPGVTYRTVLYFEVPNGLFTVRDMGIWDLIYEHVSYFTPESLRSIFEQAGFEVLDLDEDFGGQYLYVEARPATSPEEAANGWVSSSLDALVSDFAHRYETCVSQWREYLARAARERRRCLLWGAGSKGVTFANIAGQADAFAAIVDINPHKQGLYVPGTGTPVVGVEQLGELAPDEILVMNPLYLNEVRRLMKEQEVSAATTPVLSKLCQKTLRPGQS